MQKSLPAGLLVQAHERCSVGIIKLGLVTQVGPCVSRINHLCAVARLDDCCCIALRARARFHVYSQRGGRGEAL